MPTIGTSRERIKAKAIDILETNPDGVHYSDLIRKIQENLSDIPVNTINGTVWNLDRRIPEKIYKPSRGLFRLVKYRENQLSENETIVDIQRIREEDFYEPFADWLKREIEECTNAIKLGGNIFRDRWGTPDDIGVWKSSSTDIIKASVEIVSAEIKADTNDLIKAFGQACAYKIFSHKTYVVIPKNSSQEDISKLDSLCIIFGIGLVLFDNNNVNNPDFEIRVRPIKKDPDMFYVNKYMRMIPEEQLRSLL
jgi:hypothetical protein